MVDAAEAVRVLVVDDHPVVRQGLRTFLSAVDGFEVVGEAGDTTSAVEAARRLRPDVVLLDLVMPGDGGVAAIRSIRAEGLGPRVLVLTSFSSEDQVVPAVAAGADGYLLKDATPQRVAEAIAAVARGEARLDPQVVGAVMAGVGPAAPADRGWGELTPRERQVLGLLARGLSNRELATRLVVSEKTVKTHVSAILAKLRLSDRTQAALYAVRHGLGAEEPGAGGGS